MRLNNRAPNYIRPIHSIAHYSKYAAGSVLLELGDTRVIAAVTLNNAIPFFLRGKGQGWLTASYSLLPSSCRARVERESCGKRNDRAIEISRLIGRSLRSVVALDQFADKTIHIDCDIIQADGGTRSAAITAASFALQLAEKKWQETGIIKQNILNEPIAAISVGLVNETLLLDLNYDEDAQAHADFNFVMTKSGMLIEMQGTAEKEPISWSHVMQMRELAVQGIEQLFAKIYTESDHNQVRDPIYSGANVYL